MELAVLRLKPRCERRLKGGHLWIYSNEVDIAFSPLKLLSNGQQVVVETSSGKSLGVAYCNPNSLICARMVSRELLPIDGDMITHLLRQALSLRERVYPGGCYRLVYGDSDGLPGLVVDRFADVLVVQIGTAGMEALKDIVIDALDQLLKPTAIILKNDSKARQVEGLENYVEVVKGEPGDELQLVENGVKFVVPSLTGQKTGWFYDHRDNRARLARYTNGARVLDVFSYVGGWGVQAAVQGAADVVCVDSSPLAIDYVGRNAMLNNVGDKVSTLKGQANQCMKELAEAGEKFDVIVIDPPAFIKKRKDIRAGEAGYKQLNQLAMRLLGREGILVSASCSMHLQRESLIDILRSASRHVDRQCQILEVGGQGADHPIHPAIPETEYLKAMFARVYI
ncbi:MAG: class I SAM-dependent rRNA methyltransferase [Pseudomonadales bacterium]